MASEYIEAVRAFHPAGPYVVAGMCSTGGYVAYEMAQQARTLNWDPELLILFDPTNNEVAQIQCSQGSLLIQQAQEIARRVNLGEAADTEIPVLRTQLTALISELGLEPGLLQLPPHYLNQFLDLFASNHLAALSYTPQPYTGRAEIFVPALSAGDDRITSSAEWKALIPLAEVHALPIHREELYSDKQTVGCVTARLRSQLH
jgi:thioesterase domain-containing protein